MPVPMFSPLFPESKIKNTLLNTIPLGNPVQKVTSLSDSKLSDVNTLASSKLIRCVNFSTTNLKFSV